MFGFATTWFLDDRRRDMAFRGGTRSFLVRRFGGFSSTYVLFGRKRLYGAGNAQTWGGGGVRSVDVACILRPATVPDYGPRCEVSGLGSIGTASNIVATILAHECPGHEAEGRTLQLCGWLLS